MLQPTSFSVTASEWYLLADWCKQHQVRSVLEFGPGYSTTAFAQAGRRVVSCEGNQEYFDLYAPALKELGVQLAWYEESSFDLRIEGVDGTKFDLGFVDAPKSSRWPLLPRVNTALYCLRCCRLIAVHDTTRLPDRMTVGALISLGCSVVAENQGEKGLMLLTNPYWADHGEPA